MADVSDTLVTKYVLDDQYSAKAKQAAASTNTFGHAVKTAQANVGKKGAGGLSGAFSDLASGAEGLTNGLKAATVAITAVVAAGVGLVDLGMKSVEAFAKYDTIQRIFVGVYGSVKAAKQEMAYLQAEADKGNFTFKDLAESASKITMAGLKFGDFKEAIEAISLRGGGGAEKLAEVTDILMRLNGGEMGRAFMALKNLGVGPQEMQRLGAVFDKSDQFVGNTAQALALFQQIGASSGNIVKAMEGGSQAWLSDLKESFDRVFASVGEGVFDTFNKAGGSLSKVLNEAIDSGMIKDTVEKVAKLFDMDVSNNGLMKIVSSVLAGVETASVLIKTVWDGIKAVLNSPIVQFLYKWSGIGMLTGMASSLLNNVSTLPDLGRVYSSAYDHHMAQFALKEKQDAKAGPLTEPDNPMASPLTSIASYTAQTAYNTKQMLDMSRHIVGGGDLGRIGVTPVELSSVKRKGEAGASRPFHVIGSGLLERYIADQMQLWYRQLKAQGDI